MCVWDNAIYSLPQSRLLFYSSLIVAQQFRPQMHLTWSNTKTKTQTQREGCFKWIRNKIHVCVKRTFWRLSKAIYFARIYSNTRRIGWMEREALATYPPVNRFAMLAPLGESTPFTKTLTCTPHISLLCTHYSTYQTQTSSTCSTFKAKAHSPRDICLRSLRVVVVFGVA